MHYSRSPYRGGSVIRASSTYRETSPLRALSPLRSLSVDRYVDRVMDDLDVRRAYNRAMSPVRTTTYSYDGNASLFLSLTDSLPKYVKSSSNRLLRFHSNSCVYSPAIVHDQLQAVLLLLALHEPLLVLRVHFASVLPVPVLLQLLSIGQP